VLLAVLCSPRAESPRTSAVAEEEKAPEVRPLDERPAVAEEDVGVELAAPCGGGRIHLQMLLYVTQTIFLM